MRVNRRIRAREIRVIGADGQQLGIMSPDMAMQKAHEANLDLVEISPDSRPPVCRIMDYGKFKYAEKKKSAEAKRKQTVIVLKEIKLRPKIEKNDFTTKLNHIKLFLDEGHKVKITMMFRGREITHQEVARSIMANIVNEVKTIATIEQNPKLEGRNMIMIVSPSKTA